MGIGRVGCLLAGCCWGETCVTEAGEKALPWAIRFPYGAPAYIRQWEREQLTVPDELLWVAPGTGIRTPIPPEILSEPALDDNETLTRYADHLLAAQALRGSAPDSPEAARHEEQARALEPDLPGRSKQQKADYVAAAVHLARLSKSRPADQPATMADLRAVAAAQRTQWVHPTQVYDAVGLVLMFFVLSAILHRRRRHGLVIAWTMLLYPASRFVQEMLRGDNPHDVAGLTISQFLSLIVFAAGLLYMLVLLKYLPVQSPRAAEVASSPSRESPTPA
jgi:phosphatidylglycerol:prolipoprotein diacylglycerol transferase